MFRLDRDLAIVTGAFGKLGPVWIEALLGAGATVAALDRPGAVPSAAFEGLHERYAGRLRSYACDVTDRAAIDAARDVILADLGTPTVLVNNAGVDQPPDQSGQRYTVDAMPIELFRRMIDVNVAGTFQMIQSIGPSMIKRGGGSIVNIGSLYASVAPDSRFYDHFPGEVPFMKVPSYGASKAAVVNLTRFFATHWGHHGIRVNTLSPGGVLGAQDQDFRQKYGARVPLRRLAEAGDLTGPLLFLASSASSYVTGHELRVDGGFTAW